VKGQRRSRVTTARWLVRRPDPSGWARRVAHTRPRNTAHAASPAITSPSTGENTRTKPRPFTRAEKLDTQNGIRKNRKVRQRSSGPRPWPAFSSSAIPMMTASPSEVSHRRGFGSK
jgi:hypothetical protein